VQTITTERHHKRTNEEEWCKPTTPVPVLDPELPRTRTGWIWTYVSDAEHPYIVVSVRGTHVFPAHFTANNFPPRVTVLRIDLPSEDRDPKLVAVLC
jgi:hypothetical protein